MKQKTRRLLVIWKDNEFAHPPPLLHSANMYITAKIRTPNLAQNGSTNILFIQEYINMFSIKNFTPQTRTLLKENTDVWHSAQNLEKIRISETVLSGSDVHGCKGCKLRYEVMIQSQLDKHVIYPLDFIVFL